MKSLLVACAIVLAVIVVYGFIFPARPDRLKISTREERPAFTVTITAFDVTPQYRWIALHACTAARAEDMQAYCTYDWERESTQEVRLDQVQYPFVWRNVPGGLLLITAMVFDIDDRVLARQTLAVHKRY